MQVLDVTIESIHKFKLFDPLLTVPTFKITPDGLTMSDLEYETQSK